MRFELTTYSLGSYTLPVEPPTKSNANRKTAKSLTSTITLESQDSATSDRSDSGLVSLVEVWQTLSPGGKAAVLDFARKIAIEEAASDARNASDKRGVK